MLTALLDSLIGLMGKACLKKGHGLWIKPCQSVHTFWMRFPIDVLFLDKNGVVIHFIESMKPFRVSRHVLKARSVWNFLCGLSETAKLSWGIVLRFPLVNGAKVRFVGYFEAWLQKEFLAWCIRLRHRDESRLYQEPEPYWEREFFP